MLGWIQQRAIAHTGVFERPIDRFTARIWNMRVPGTEDHQKLPANFFGARKRSRIRVLTEFAVMDARAVVTDGGANIRLERSSEGEVAADAETDDADFAARDLGIVSKPVQASAAIGIEMGDRSFGGGLLAAGAAGVIKRDHRSGRFDTAINFRRSSNKSVPGQPHAEAQQRRSELENIGIAPDTGIWTFCFWRGDEGSHRGTRQRNVSVFGF